MSAPTIRRAAARDAEALHRLLTALTAELGYAAAHRGTAADLVRHGFGENPLFRAQLAEAAGTALGAAVYFPEFSTLRGAPGVYLQDLYLVPAARSGGLGRRLLAAVVQDAADWGAAYLRLAAHEGNEALGFYARLGFQTDPRERAWWVEGAALEQIGDRT